MSNETEEASLPPVAGIPQSTALREAQVDSLSELMSRDPEGYQDQDLDRIIEELRRHRERIVAARGTEGGAKRKAKQTLTANSAGDLGL